MKKILFAVFLVIMQSYSFAAPSDGRGNKWVISIDETFPNGIDCGDGQYLSIKVDGWVQGRTFQENGNRNVDITVYHLNLTWINDIGDTFFYGDRGLDRAYFVTNIGGETVLHVAVTGHTAGNVIGRVVLNLDTEEVIFDAGRHPFGGNGFDDPFADDYACEVLY